MKNWRAPEYIEAWERLFLGVAAAREGALILESLMMVVSEIGPAETCALQAHNGRRSFAAEILRIAEQAHVVNASPGTTDRTADVRPGSEPRAGGGPGAGSGTKRRGPRSESGEA